MRDAPRFVVDELAHGARELGFRDPVRRPRRDGHQAARELVLALCPALEATDAARDAELDRLVVARLEVQAGHVLGRTPVAAVERVGVEHVECRADRHAVAHAEHQHEVVGHRVGDAQEEVEIQVRRRVVPAVRVVVAAHEEAPVGVPDLAPDLPDELDAGLADLAALLLQLLALLVVHAREEVVEVREAVVRPVELHRAPRHAAEPLELAGFGLGREEAVECVDLRLAGELQRRTDEQRARPGIRCQHARPRHRRERNRRQQLRVVVPPRARPRVGPRPVEDVLAVRMALEIQRQRAVQFGAVAQQQVARRPAGVLAGRAALVHRVEERVRQQRMSAGEAIPRGRRDGGERIDDLDDRTGGHGRGRR